MMRNFGVILALAVLFFNFIALQKVLAYSSTNQRCSQLNGLSGGQMLPDRICITYISTTSPGYVEISLLRRTGLVDKISGESFMQAAGVSCNRHTGDCIQHSAFIKIDLHDDRFRAELVYSNESIVGTVYSNNVIQNTIESY